MIPSPPESHPPLSTGLLVPVWHGYRWMAPLTLRWLDRFWPTHPPVWFCGLEQTDGLPLLPISPGTDLTNWSAMVLDGVNQMRRKGFDLVYLVAEEHVPLAPCNEEHLNVTLPRLMKDLPAVYISLMGWDNRRFRSRSPVLAASQFKLKHLVSNRDPRFNLHPALWRIDALQKCCELALEDTEKNGNAWHFEKCNTRENRMHSPEWKSQCYQIHSLSLRQNKPSFFRLAANSAEIFIFGKLRALVPLIPNSDLAVRYLKAIGIDNFYCDGPYPMFYSGLMAKGRLNSFLQKYLRRTASGRLMLDEILQLLPPC